MPGVANAALTGCREAAARECAVFEPNPSWPSDPDSNFGLLVTPSGAIPEILVVIDSKENTATSHPAMLSLLFASIGPPGPIGATDPVGPMEPMGADGPSRLDRSERAWVPRQGW